VTADIFSKRGPFNVESVLLVFRSSKSHYNIGRFPDGNGEWVGDTCEGVTQNSKMSTYWTCSCFNLKDLLVSVVRWAISYLEMNSSRIVVRLAVDAMLALVLEPSAHLP
jgi:hypothetical protein